MPLARRVPEIRHDRSVHSSNRRSRDRRNHGAQKANLTQPLKNQQLYFENEAFLDLIKRFFSTLSWFCDLVRPRFKIWPSTYRPYVVSTKNRRVVLPSRRVPEVWNRSPFIKSSIPGSSKSRCSRKQTKPSLSTTYFENEAFFSISYQNVF